MTDERRRVFLRQGLLGLAALPLGAGLLARRPLADELPYLEPGAEERARSAMWKTPAMPVSTLPIALASCRHCLFFEADTQGCQIFPQYRVTPGGWCQSWAPAD